MSRALWLLLVSLVTVAADQKDPLTRAHQLYNQHQYDEAITAASEARRTPALADAAAVVLARAYLERYRNTPAPNADDLAMAREALKAVDAAKLTPRDHVELLIGLGESLYFDDRFGAAAEMFDLALAQSGIDAATPRERVLDWWANAMDRQAQISADADRKSTYTRLLDRMDTEAKAHPDSAVAAYWVVAAARGTDDLDRAWQAAIAAWVRAPLVTPKDAAVTLRADLDRIVVDALIPERARQLVPRGDRSQIIAALSAEWTAVKEQWKGGGVR
jgi:tetratricopeptide (TPR) repeat protein